MNFMELNYNMSFEEFAEEIRLEIPNYLLDVNIESVRIEKVTKNNGVELTGLVILEEGANAAPNIYLQHFYYMYQAGKSLDDICLSIANDYREAYKVMGNMDLVDFARSENLYVKLVNYDANKDILSKSVFEKNMDMAFMVRLKCNENADGLCSTVLDYKLLEQMDLTYDEAIKIAKENTLNSWPTKIVPMSEIIGSELFENLEEPIEMYVLTNSVGINGAAAIMDIDTINDYFGEKDMYIIPSSIHEIILIPDIGKGEEQLSNLVKHVNKFVVSRDEVLSSNIYKYNGKDKTIVQCTGLDRSKDNPERDM